ncbi:MAG TPA: hypothetical protein VG244_07370 [Acidimicrobiales bacterium]|nr:hypothetical protein [Acidimicrobiales bacterium]
MDGIGTRLWRSITARLWQRMALGVIVIVIGMLLQNYVVTAFGVVFVVLPFAGWIKRRRGGAAEGSVEAPKSADL